MENRTAEQMIREIIALDLTDFECRQVMLRILGQLSWYDRMGNVACHKIIEGALEAAKEEKGLMA